MSNNKLDKMKKSLEESEEMSTALPIIDVRDCIGDEDIRQMLDSFDMTCNSSIEGKEIYINITSIDNTENSFQSDKPRLVEDLLHIKETWKDVIDLRDELYFKEMKDIGFDLESVIFVGMDYQCTDVSSLLDDVGKIVHDPLPDANIMRIPPSTIANIVVHESIHHKIWFILDSIRHAVTCDETIKLVDGDHVYYVDKLTSVLHIIFAKLNKLSMQPCPKEFADLYVSFLSGIKYYQKSMKHMFSELAACIKARDEEKIEDRYIQDSECFRKVILEDIKSICEFMYKYSYIFAITEDQISEYNKYDHFDERNKEISEKLDQVFGKK